MSLHCPQNRIKTHLILLREAWLRRFLSFMIKYSISNGYIRMYRLSKLSHVVPLLAYNNTKLFHSIIVGPKPHSYLHEDPTKARSL